MEDNELRSVILAQSLIPQEEQQDILEWTQREDIKRVLYGINESIKTAHDVLETNRITIDFDYVAPGISQRDLQKVLNYLTYKGYTLSPIAIRRLTQDNEPAGVGVRVSWNTSFFSL